MPKTLLFPKQCGHTEGVLAVRVKARCLIEVVAGACGNFPVEFHQNGSCEMSMCVSTAQARAKRVLRNQRPAFFL